METRTLKSIYGWVYGLSVAFIQGGATAGSAWLSLALGTSIGIKDLPVLNVRAFLVMSLWSGIGGAVLFLKNSPLPKLDDLPAYQEPPVKDAPVPADKQ